MPGSIDTLLEQIAKEHLDMETLKERKSDSLDFKEVSVCGVKRALEAAYNAGIQEALKQISNSKRGL